MELNPNEFVFYSGTRSPGAESAAGHWRTEASEVIAPRCCEFLHGIQIDLSSVKIQPYADDCGLSAKRWTGTKITCWVEVFPTAFTASSLLKTAQALRKNTATPEGCQEKLKNF